eukprot:COSAG02_NODE_7369_length_3044_cov_4.622750_1_plen_118_part_00
MCDLRVVFFLKKCDGVSDDMCDFARFVTPRITCAHRVSQSDLGRQDTLRQARLVFLIPPRFFSEGDSGFFDLTLVLLVLLVLLYQVLSYEYLRWIYSIVQYMYSCMNTVQNLQLVKN